MKKYLLSLVAGSVLGLGFALIHNSESSAVVKSHPVQDTKYVASCEYCNNEPMPLPPFAEPAPPYPDNADTLADMVYRIALNQWQRRLAEYNASVVRQNTLHAIWAAHVQSHVSN